MFYRLGEGVFQFRWYIIGAWAILFLASAFFAPRVTDVLRGGFGDADTEAREGLEILKRDFGWSDSSVIVVFNSPKSTVPDPDFRSQVEASLSKLRYLTQLEQIETYYDSVNPRLISNDMHTTYAVLHLNSGSEAESYALVPKIRQSLLGSSLNVWVTGGVPIFADLNVASERDLQRAEMVAIPLVLVALLFVFGSLVAAGIPVAMGVVSVSITLSALYFVGQITDVSVFALNITTFLGLGVAIDYSLFVVSRYREEAKSWGWSKEAVAHTTASAGLAITFSAVTTMLGLSGLLLFEFMMLRSVGVGGLGVIFVSLLMALTLMPALLSVVGRRVNSLAIVPEAVTRVGFWSGWAERVMRHPVLILVTVLVFLLSMGTPFINVKMGMPWASSLPQDMESRKGWEHLEQAFGPGELSPLLVAITSEAGIFRSENLDALYNFTRELESDARVRRVESIVTLSPEITKEQYGVLYADRTSIVMPEIQRALAQLARENTTQVRVITDLAVNSDNSKGLVRDIRLMDLGGDLDPKVTGSTANLMDVVDVLYDDFPKAIMFIIITTYLALFVLFRSVVLPVKAILMNALSITASYGALVFVFQDGNLEWLLNFTAMGYIPATVPILLFCVLFGLSMDYEVFLLSRIKESYDATGDNTASIALGIERTGKIITSAALVLVLVSGAFSLADVLIVKAVGFGIALAILIDATVVRALLVPAVMRIMGDLNWWAPRALKSIVPNVWRRP